MSTPFTFPSNTPNYSLPMLFSGQAQKEFFVNQAIGLLDAIAAGIVEATVQTPPTNPSDGTCYIVADNATGEWQGREGNIAISIAGAWHFISPRNGMRVYDRTAGATLHHSNDWIDVPAPAIPAGGTVVDTQVRQALTELINALKTAGILRGPT